jgi:Xaa-Pro dipeptidase
VALHFEREEYDRRLEAARRALVQRGLDGLLMFQQESMYYLTGYDTFGFCFFQCLYLGVDGGLALLTRSADLRQAWHTSTIEDVRIWNDVQGANPAVQLRDMLRSLGVQDKRLGIETNAYGLTHFNGKRVEAGLRDLCTLIDASSVIDELRAVKSPAELVYVRRAAALADAAMKAGLEQIGPGADEAWVLAAMQATILAGGGDYPGNEFIIGSGDDALLCRYKSGRRVLSDNDQLTLEFAGVWRHYHAALMRTVVIGTPRPQHLRMAGICQQALAACERKLRPGYTAGEVFDAHARVMDVNDMSAHRLKACGYSLGARFTPSWMDAPMFYESNGFVLAADMVVFAHMILMDSDTGTAMTLGRTYIVTDHAPEPLSTLPLGLLRR